MIGRLRAVLRLGGGLLCRMTFIGVVVKGKVG